VELNAASSNDDWSSDSGSDAALAPPTIVMCDSSRDMLLDWREKARSPRRLPDFDPLEATLPHPSGKIAPPPCKAGHPMYPDPAPLSPMPALPPTPRSTSPRQPPPPATHAGARPAPPPRGPSAFGRGLDPSVLGGGAGPDAGVRRRLFGASGQPVPSPRDAAVPTPSFGAPTPAFGCCAPSSPRLDSDEVDCVKLLAPPAPSRTAWHAPVDAGPPPSPSSAADEPCRIDELWACEPPSPGVGSPVAWAGPDPSAGDRVETLFCILEAQRA